MKIEITARALFIVTGASGSSPSKVQIWAVQSIAKVRPEHAAQMSNAVWNGQSRTITVEGAKNEHIPFQLVISVPPPPPNKIPAESGFFVSVDDLTSSAGGRIRSTT